MKKDSIASYRKPVEKLTFKNTKNEILDYMYSDATPYREKDGTYCYPWAYYSENDTTYVEATNYFAFEDIIEYDHGKGIILKDGRVFFDFDKMDGTTAKLVLDVVKTIEDDFCIDLDYAREWLSDDLWSVCKSLAKEMGKSEDYADLLYTYMNACDAFSSEIVEFFGQKAIKNIVTNNGHPRSLCLLSGAISYIEKNGTDCMAWDTDDLRFSANVSYRH